MKPIHRLSIFSLVVPMSMPLAAQSTWTGTTNANWTTATNWNPGIPANGDNITIADTTANGLTLDDASHSVGSITIGDLGTRTSAFILQTNTANTLTIAGGFTANGGFTAIGTRLRGNYVISADQTWQIGGEPGSHSLDRGVAFNEVSSGNLGSLTLNANLIKSGPGQITFGATTLSGAGDVSINEGSIKLNAGGSLPLTVGGTGKIAANNSSALIFSKNSGTFNITRPLQFNNTSRLETGSGSTNQTGIFEIASNMEWTGAHTITNNNNTNNGTVNYRFTGVMSGSGSITKNGPSQLILSGAAPNTLGGQVTVAAGELSLDKTAGVTAVPGNILVTGGTLRVNKAQQIADTSSITVTGGLMAFTADRAETIASLNISSGATSSLSGLTVTGATTITAGTQELNSGQTFTTHSLSLSNNAAIRPVGNATAPASTTINVGAGGLTLDTGRVVFGNQGNATTNQFTLGGDLVSTGTSLFTATNYNGPRIIDLQAGSRSFAVNDGTLDIRATVQNGSLVKSGPGTLILSRAGSTADLSVTEGPVQIVSQVDAANVSLAGGSLLMDVGGATPSMIIASGDVTATGTTIEISAVNGGVAPGVLELVRYGGTLTGTPTINIPAQLAASRMNPVVDYGTGINSAIAISSTASPLALTWTGSNGGVWDNNSTSNFDGGAERFYPLDSVIFDDTGVNTSVQLNSAVFPTDVVFDHGSQVPTYTVTGSGSISGPTKLTKNGTGTTILATDNNYTGATDILGGTLQIGNGGLTGSLGSGAVLVDSGATLRFARSGSAIVGNTFTGFGDIVSSGPGTVALTANSTAFSGLVSVTGGTLQFGDGGADGSLGTAPIDISAGATFAIKRSGVPTIANVLSGSGAVTVTGGSPILTGSNTHTGGITVTDGGIVRLPGDWTLGELPLDPIPDAIRLNFGGLKNQDSYTATDGFRGVTITGEAYFTAGWANTLAILGPITGTGNVFINYDSGIVAFSDPTSDWNGILTLGADKPGFTGATGGNLEITSITDGGIAGPLGKASADPGNLVFNGGRLIYSGEAGSTNRGFTLQGPGTIDVPFSSLAISGLATGPGRLTKAGTGSLILSGTNDFVGEKIIAGGTLVMKSANALGDTASSVRFTGTTGVLDLAMGAVAPYSFDIAAGNSGTILAGVATPGPGINHTLGDLKLSTVTLNVGANADVSGGSPRATFGDLSLSAGASGTTTLNPTTADITLGSVSIGSGNFAKTLSLGGTSQNNVVTGTIADGLNVVSLRKDNDSVWTLPGDNSFTGNVTVDDGVLALTHSNALGGASKTLSIAGDAGNNRLPELRVSGGIAPTVSVLNISGAGIASTGALHNVSGDNTLTVTTQVNMILGNGNTTLYSDAGTLTINSPLVRAGSANRALTLSGPGNGVINAVIANGTTANLPVTKTGTGTWTLNGAHTYTGATTVTEGVLALGQAALSDSAEVSIAGGATLNLNFTGTDRVGSLVIDGVTKLDGVYSASTDPGFITGSGSIRVGAGPQGYDTWASAYPFEVGVNDGADQDPDGDGIANLLEYVLGGIPVGPEASNTSILPAQALTTDDLTLTFRRSDASETDVTLKVQWSADMSTWHDFATIGPVSSLPAVNVTEDSPSGDIDTVVVSVPKSNAMDGKLFVRLIAVQ